MVYSICIDSEGFCIASTTAESRCTPRTNFPATLARVPRASAVETLLRVLPGDMCDTTGAPPALCVPLILVCECLRTARRFDVLCRQM